MPSIGWQEMIIILIIIMVVIGPKKLPEVGRSLGKGIREFKSSATELKEQTIGEEAEPVKAVETDSA